MKRLVYSLRSLWTNLWRKLLRGLRPAWLEWKVQAGHHAPRFIPTLQILEERNHPTDVTRLLAGALPGMIPSLMGTSLVSGLESLLSPLPAPAGMPAPSHSDLLAASAEAKPLPLAPDASQALFFASNFSAAPQNALPGLDESQPQPQLQAPLDQWNEQTLARQTQTLDTINLNEPLSQNPFGDANAKKPQGSGGGGGGSGGGAGGGGGGGEAPQVSLGGNGLGTGQPMNMTPGALNGGAPPPSKPGTATPSAPTAAPVAHAATPTTTTPAANTTNTTTQNTTTQNTTTQTAAALLGQGVQPQIRFVANQGQAADPSVPFVALGLGYQTFFQSNQFVLSLPVGSNGAGGTQTTDTSNVVTVQLVGANPNVTPVGQGLLDTRTNYFSGDSSQWLANAANYSELVYPNIYNGIDLTFTASASGNLEYSWTVHPGADPSQIQMQISGPSALQTDGQGNLDLTLGSGQLTEQAPSLYQQNAAGNQTAVTGQFVLGSNNTVGFQAGAYDLTQTLVIDPQLTWSTYLGGSGSDVGNAIATDAAGNVYVTGSTSSTNFPVLSGYSSSNSGAADVFVTKYSPAGQMLWSTYLGGSGTDSGNGIAVDAAGAVWVVGSTGSSNYPTMNPLYGSLSGSTTNAFITKLAPSGDALEFSTYLGGSGTTSADAIAIASGNVVYVGGSTTSTNFPTTTGAFQTSQPDATYGSGFISSISNNGSTLLGSTYLGSNSTQSQVTGLAYRSNGPVYAAGYAQYQSSLGPPFAFPAPLGYRTTTSGSEDAFLEGLPPTLTSLPFGTLYGGNSITVGTDVALDSYGYPYLVGYTNSTNLPTTAGAYQSSMGIATDAAFVAKFNPTENGLLYATYLGGAGTTEATGVGVDGSGDFELVGWTNSSSFPTSSAFQSSYGGGTSDGFITQFSTSGTLEYSSFYGGSGANQVNGIAMTPWDEAYLTGLTNSSNLPTVNSLQSYGGGQDAFVAAVGPIPASPAITAITSGTLISSNNFATNSQNLTISGTAADSSTVTLYRTDTYTALGTATASGAGAWSFNYTGTTLPAGSYGFQTTDTLSGYTGALSQPTLVAVDLTAPTVDLVVDNTTAALGPQLHVTAWDEIGIPTTANVTIDVDLLNVPDQILVAFVAKLNLYGFW